MPSAENITISQIQAISKSFFEDTVRIRRHLHMNPELSFQEYETSQYVKDRLTEWGVSFQEIAGTGVLAIICGEMTCPEVPDPTTVPVIALRADLDALPIQEVPGRLYGSTRSGIMHACGHDAHTSSLLTTARILQNLRKHFSGTVKFLFQPGEEKLPGGASLMIRDGALENPRVEAVIGQHVMPLIPAGKVGFRSGKYMASTDELYIKVKGKGGHGAQPHQNIDPILISAHLITALQQLVSRMAHPTMPSVLSIGRLEAKGATNVIPDTVYMEGTFRTFDEGWRKDAHVKMKKLAEGLVESMGGSCDFEIHNGYPFLVNEEKLTAKVRGYAEEYLGRENVVDLDLWMAGEDFAYYSQVRDACFYRLGTMNACKGITASVHTPEFDIEESVLSFSPGLMAYMALKQLGNAIEPELPMPISI